MTVRSLAIALACATVMTTVLSVAPIGYGHSAYTYGPVVCDPGHPCEPSNCNDADFAPDIAAFNKKVDKTAQIKQVLSYGGDVELWGTKEDPQACWAPATANCDVSVFYDKQNAAAAAKYKAVDGVESIMALVDGRLDGWDMIAQYDHYDPCDFGDFYPNLNNLTSDQISGLAQKAAALYCADDNVRGIQVDLEPFKDPYTLSITQFVGDLSKELRESEKCVSAKYPDGRSISYFTFAHSQSHDFYSDALGANGFAVFSVYDLDPKKEDGGFIYNTPDEFAQKLRYELNFIPAVVQTEGKFSLAVPMAASCHEYEHYIPEAGSCGPACIAESSNATMADYVTKIFDVLLSDDVKSTFGGLFCMNETAQTQFVGLSWWTWTHTMSYPPNRWYNNQFTPPTPPAAALDLLAANLAKFSESEACTNPAGCDGSSDRANGCPCDHSWECTSDWCSAGTCAQHPNEWLSNPPKAWVKHYGNPMEHPGARAALAAEWK